MICYPSDIETVEQFVGESIVELKQMKTKAKSAFTKVRSHLLAQIQDKEVGMDNIKGMCNTGDNGCFVKVIR